MSSVVRLVVTKSDRLDSTGQYRIEFQTVQKSIQTTKGNLIFGNSKKYHIFSPQGIEVGAEFELDFNQVKIIEVEFPIDKNNPDGETWKTYTIELL